MQMIQTGDVARALDVKPSTVRRLAESGELPYVQKLPGPLGAYVFEADVVNAFVAKRRAALEQKLARMGGAA